MGTVEKETRERRVETFTSSLPQDSYSWMADLVNGVAMRHMDVYIEQEEKYTDGVAWSGLSPAQASERDGGSNGQRSLYSAFKIGSLDLIPTR